MSYTEKCAKLSKELLAYLDSQPENSVDLLLMVSYACLSQTGQGFEEFVNAMNTDRVRSKVRNLRIVDTSYLYRHTIPAFEQYAGANARSRWLEENEPSLQKLQINTDLRTWGPYLETDEFKHWLKQIYADFNGDENGKGVVLSFRDIVVAEAAVFSSKMQVEMGQCIKFILEECAQACAYFTDQLNLIYPMKMTGPLSNVMERYNIHVNHYRYRTSVQNHEMPEQIDFDQLNKEIVAFMRDKVSNVNFFVMDKYGNNIYKNKAYESIVGSANFGRLDPKSWNNSLEVMRTREQRLISEEYGGHHFLTLKAPLIIDDKVEGVLGMALDITDKKKKDDLEKENELQKIRLGKQEEFQAFVGQLAHDIVFPISALEAFMQKHNFDEKDHIMLRDIISKIKNIGGALLSRYKQDEKLKANLQEQHILVPLVLLNIVDQKNAQLDCSDVHIDLDVDPNDNFSFIIGDQTNFSRMISNLLNNAVEATNGRGNVKIKLRTDQTNVSVDITDDGIGMPDEMVKQILNHNTIGTTKKNGHGIGLEQVMKTVSMYKGKLSLESKLGVGTKFTVTFPKANKPDYIADEISLKKSSTAVVLDDDPSVFKLWQDKLKDYKGEVELKCFTDYVEARDFIDTFEKGRENLFLFSDYDLRNQQTDGIWFVLENKMQEHSMIVSWINNDLTFQEKVEKSKLKFLPKQFLPTVNIKVCNG